jgi:hypothetical protein
VVIWVRGLSLIGLGSGLLCRDGDVLVKAGHGGERWTARGRTGLCALWS